MKTRFLTIRKIDGKVQHLSDIYPVIETNTILNKTITGIGATYSEIKAPRNSVIIEPTKPVIDGKINNAIHKDDNLFGVYQGVYQDKIIDYIERSLRDGKCIKILTTPESFRKVQDAFEELDIDIRFDGYFLLFDEIQKTVKDCDYRQDIILPMDLFFECRDKAIVSATPPRKFRDPRFNDFTVVKITPDFDFHKEINLWTTNNVLEDARKLVNLLKDKERPVFLFVNSTDMIYALMEKMEVMEQSAVFCSEKSVDKLNKQLNFSAAYDKWEASKMAHYNWMTSRFYSALDIDLSERPDIIMLTDCYIADYTIIDPYMDAVQIIGRFRNGVNYIYHIRNYNYRIPESTEESLIEGLRCAANVYAYLGTMADSASTSQQKEAFMQAQATIPYTKYQDENGRINFYAVDNHIDEELTKSLYRDKTALTTVYNSCGYFTVYHTTHYYKMGDFERLKIESKTASIREKRREIVAQLEQLGVCETEAEQQYKRDLEFADPLIVEAYEVLGKDKIEQLNYSVTRLRQEIIIKKHQDNACSTDAIKLINATFYSQQWYSADDIRNNLRAVFLALNIPHPKAITSHTIREYFDAVEKKRKNKRGYFLRSPRFAV